jgi:two-component system sensor histidine kinase DesK
VSWPARDGWPGPAGAGLCQNGKVSAFTVRKRAAGGASRAPAPAGPAVDPAAVTSRPVAAPPPPALTGDDGLDRYLSARGGRSRRFMLVILIALFLIGPVAVQFHRRPDPGTAILLFGGLAFLGITGWLVIAPQRPGRVPWPLLIANVALAAFLFIVGGSESWLIIPACAAAACGRFTVTVRPAAFGAITCGAAGLVVAVQHYQSAGDWLILAGVPAMATFFAYSAGKRNEAVETLRQTRAELARVAVAEERLRIARDLHDLLGHSLSLITLKAELSRRMIATDVAGAAREMSELETVARQSLSDVREAVAGYRQPDLAAELGAARQMLAAAGIAGQISVPDELQLPAPADTVLAWAVREGVTNVVRHARATSAAITVRADRDQVTVEVTNDGSGLPGGSLRLSGPGRGGSGLAGLGERVRKLGGELTAGPVAPSGFRLRVTIPADGPAATPADASGS